MAQMNPNPSNTNDPNLNPNAPKAFQEDLEVRQDDLNAAPVGRNDETFKNKRDVQSLSDDEIRQRAAEEDLKEDAEHTRGKDTNPDPITGAPGSHPVGTGIGAAAGGAAGAAIGSVIPGAGTVAGGVIGAVIGAVGGGLAGKGIAEAIDPTAEDAYWRDNYRARSYVPSDADYDLYQPAYRFGWESRTRYQGRQWEDVEADLRRDWERSEHQSRLSWDQARPAVFDAWNRVDKS